MAAQIALTCEKYKKAHKGECLARVDVFFRYGKLGHHVIDYRGGCIKPQSQTQTHAINQQA